MLQQFHCVGRFSARIPVRARLGLPAGKLGRGGVSAITLGGLKVPGLKYVI
jgi:hypothetical protein